MKYLSLIIGLVFVCSIATNLTASPHNGNDGQSYLQQITEKGQQILLAKKDKTGKRQNETKMGVGQGKGQGLEHRKNKDEDGKRDKDKDKDKAGSIEKKEKNKKEKKKNKGKKKGKK